MELSEYMMIAIALSAVMGVIGALSHSSLAAECTTGIGIISLSVLLSLAAGEIGSASPPVLPDYSEQVQLSGNYIEVTQTALLGGISDYICGEYSLSSDEVVVYGEGYSFSELRFSRLTVSLTGAAALADVRGMRDRLCELFVSSNGECRVVIDFAE